jgi:hypothetical protein
MAARLDVRFVSTIALPGRSGAGACLFFCPSSVAVLAVSIQEEVELFHTRLNTGGKMDQNCSGSVSK